MKKVIITSILLLCSVLIFAQEEKQLGVFKSDTTWLDEIIKFPISFAPEINYEGYEDLRFAKQWRDRTHDNFWCYTFAWYITNFEELNADILEHNIKLYYDGIMKAVNKKKDFKVPETTVLFIKNDMNENGIDYTGKIHVYDSFTSEAMITLNIRVKMHHCDTKKTKTVVFRLSPQNFSHEVWERFNEITVRENHCD